MIDHQLLNPMVFFRLLINYNNLLSHLLIKMIFIFFISYWKEKDYIVDLITVTVFCFAHRLHFYKHFFFKKRQNKFSLENAFSYILVHGIVFL